MDNIDPAVKQYLVFSFVISVILGVIVSFILVDSVKGTFAYGFPIPLADAEGITMFIYRVINSLVLGLFFTIPVYLGLKYIQTR